MNFLLRNFIIAFIVSFSLYSCSQTETVATPSAKEKKAVAATSTDFQFEVGQRIGGTAFYSMNTYTGEVSYMVDFGEEAGKWFNYGNAIQTGGSKLILEAVETPEGVIFYAMDSGTGQLYYMTDHGEDPAVWYKFGGMIRQNGLNMLQFNLNDSPSGRTFYAYDSFTHQTYFLNIYGDNAGKWQKYGTPYKAEKE